MNINEIVVYNGTEVDYAKTEERIDASLLALKTQLLADVGTFAADQDVIATAVETVFASYEKLNMPALASFALKELGDRVTPQNHAILTARVLDYVRANSGEGKLFTSAKGPKGGVTRNAK